MKVAVPKEIHPGERRVAATPDTVKRLIALGFEVAVQAGAGEASRYTDDAYAEAGAEIIQDAAALWAAGDVVVKVRPPEVHADLDLHEASLLKQGTLLISILHPRQREDLLQAVMAQGASAIALDAIPRITRAQKMDVLSSQANIVGYRAVVEAAAHYGGFFSGQITAAGKTPPAHVLIIGAGVAGLAAIGAARGLGASVKAFDVRLAAKEQVLSMGAKFLELEFDESGEGEGGYAKIMSKEFIDAEMAAFRAEAPVTDIIITTALIPGRKAPILITKDMVESMKPGSVVVDIAAERGGNCEYTVPGEVVEVNGVTIVGFSDLASRLATHASQFFSVNIVHLLDDMGGAEGFRIDHDDEAVRGALAVENGELMWPPPKREPPPPKAAEPEAPEAAAEPAPVAKAPSKPEPKKGGFQALPALMVAIVLALMGVYAPTEFIQHFTVFVLSCFVGWQVVWNVSAALHTPLMSVTNAISGIIIVGGMLQAASPDINAASILGAVAVGVASVNVFGGFYVTQRMLQMFRR